MDREKRKKLISSMLLYCLAGDLAIRLNYGGILISRIESYLIDEVVMKDPNHSYLASIMAALDNTIDSCIQTRKEALQPLDEEKLKNVILSRVFPVDRTWAEEEALKSLNALGDLSGIRLARSYYYASIDASSQSGKNPIAYSDAIKNMDKAMQYIVNISERYELAGFGGNEWRENITTSKTEAS